MNLSISATTLLVGLVGGFATLVAIIFVLRAHYRTRSVHSLAAELKPQDRITARNKYPGVDVFRHSNSFLVGGLASAMFVCLLAFSWAQDEVALYIPSDTGIGDELFEEIIRTPYEPEQPALPKPPPAAIELIPDELAPEDQVFEDLMPVDEPNPLAFAPPLPTTAPPVPGIVAPPPPAPVEIVDIFTIVEQMPRFSGCENAGLSKDELKTCAEKRMLEYIYTNVRYPKIAQQNGIEGKAIISFVVEKDGSISGAKILRGPGGGIPEEALRVVNSFPKWIPGKQRGDAVRVAFTLPVVFKLMK